MHADDVLTICWTSGTEGMPKGVPRSHNHWIAGSIAHYDGAQIRPRDRLLNPFPLVNMAAIGGCFMSWLRAAGTLLLHHPFELPVYLQQIAAEKPEYAIAPPAVLMLLLQNEALLKGVDLSCLRCIGSGSAPLPPVMIRAYKERYGIEIINNFGSNEGIALCSGPLEAPDPEQRARLFPRFGRPELDWPQRIAKITHTRLVDPETTVEVLEPARPGEMQIRGPVVFDGYFAAPEVNARSFTDDGWFRTGDLFEIDASGRYYQFVGRLKQQINRGGVKISPDEIDAVLAEHPDIVEAAVVGYPDEVLGERICAVSCRTRTHGDGGSAPAALPPARARRLQMARARPPHRAPAAQSGRESDPQRHRADRRRSGLNAPYLTNVGRATDGSGLGQPKAARKGARHGWSRV